jgi:hypothetical protein
MKVTNWRRKLMASLVAGGLMAPAAASASDLNTNLVIDPSFENTDPGDVGPFESHRLLNWPDSNLDGNSTDDNYAYRFTQNYAGVNTPAGAGANYFTGGFSTTAGQATIAQSVDVSTGATGALIPTGEATFRLSGFFSSYATQADASRVRVRFLDASATELARDEIGGFNFVQSLPTQLRGTPPDTYDQRDWGQTSQAGLIPVGTASVSVEVVSDISAGNHDGYVDSIDFRVVNASSVLAFLEINTITGQVTIRNQTGAPIHIDYYEVTSASNALNATAWNSLQEQNLAGFPAGNGTGNGWEQFGGSDAGVIGESYLTGNSALANNSTVGLGPAFNVGGAHDLVFRYGAVLSAAPPPTGDYNNDGTVDAADYVVWRKSNINGQQGYDDWRANFGKSGGPTGPGTLVGGFVRYVTAGAGSAAPVPEPGGVWLVGIGIASLAVAARRRNTLSPWEMAG